MIEIYALGWKYVVNGCLSLRRRYFGSRQGSSLGIVQMFLSAFQGLGAIVCLQVRAFDLLTHSKNLKLTTISL
jgi:hypothetical protein